MYSGEVPFILYSKGVICVFTYPFGTFMKIHLMPKTCCKNVKYDCILWLLLKCIIFAMRCHEVIPVTTVTTGGKQNLSCFYSVN